MELFADILQLDLEIILRDTRKDEQKFIAAESNEGIGLPDAFPHDIRRRFQRGVSGVVAVGVVIDLEIVQVEQGHAHRAFHPPHDLFIIAAVVRIGQGVVIELGVIARNSAEQRFAVVRVDDGIAVHPLQKFHHIGLAVHF